MSAIKYGDLSNQATKDYIFDIDRFTSFEGNTGPYILYTIVRIKSILNRYEQENKDTENGEILEAANESEKVLMLALTGFPAVVEGAFEEKRHTERAPISMSWPMHSTAFTMRQRFLVKRMSGRRHPGFRYCS